MSVTIQIGQKRATVTNGVWKSRSPELKALCIEVASTGFPVMVDDPDYYLATEVLNVVDGVIVNQTPPPVEIANNVKY